MQPPTNQPQQYAPTPGQPQYGMQQQGYYPPPKKGIPGWAIALIIVAVALFVVPFVIGIAAVFLMPGVASNTRDAQRAEGEQLMGSARDYLRVEYSKTVSAQDAFQAFRAKHSRGDFDGVYYGVDPSPQEIRTSTYNAQVTCSPTPQASGSGKGTLKFVWSHGASTIEWQ